MLAAHHDQENRVHGQQAAAAAKPLNQGVKGFGARTPGNKAPKTPFKVPLNDENNAGKGGKSVLKTNGKGNENLLFAGKKGGQLGKDAFVTPAGPRNRAPLGMKTTNAKGQAFQTPAPLTIDPKTANKTQQKSKSPRLRRAKVKVLQAEEDAPLGEPDDEDEIEYMPPKEKPLPDLHEDFPPDLNLDMLKGENFTRGMYSTYFNEVDENGYPKAWHDGEREAAEYAEKAGEIIAKGCEETWAEIDETMNELRLEMGMEPVPSSSKGTKSLKLSTAKGALNPKQTQNSSRAPSTIASKSAASALSQPKPKSSFSSSTASTTARASVSSAGNKKSALSANKPAVNHNLATAASKNTIGYSTGRAVASNIRKPVAQTAVQQRSRPVSSLVNKSAHSRSSSQATITPSRYHSSKENDENAGIESTKRFKPFTYAEETKWLEEMRNKELGITEDGEDLEECMRGYLPDNLLLGDDVFEEFEFKVPEM